MTRITAIRRSRRQDATRRQVPTAVAVPAPVQVPPTPMVIGELLMTRLEEKIRDDIKSANNQLESWKDQFTADPMHALEWSSSMFDQAARRWAAEMTKSLVDQRRDADEYARPSDLAIVRQVRSILREEILRKVRWTSQSTSPTANLTELAKTAAMAQLLQSIEMWMEYRGVA